MVVMAFDEEGSPSTRARRIKIAIGVQNPHRRGRLPARRYHLRPRTSSRSQPALKSTTTTAQDFIGACGAVQTRTAGTR
ncbi:hypothetical protein ACLK19_27095 [Escherichia coli]